MSQKKLKKIRKNILILEKTENVQSALEKTGLRETITKIFKENFGWLLLITLVVVAVYFNSLGGDFVSDDYATIPQGPRVNDFWYMFSNSASFSNYIVYKLFGMTSTLAHHSFSVLIYLSFCWLSFFIIEIIFNNKWLTRATIALFVVLPIHVEAVSWISGRIYLILAIYTMVAFLGFIFYFKNNNPKYLLITMVAIILAFITDKPRPFALVLLVIIYLVLVGVKRIKINWGKVILFSFIVTVVAVILAWPYVLSRISIVNSGTNISETIFYNPFFQYPTAVAKYLQLLWFPADLTLYHTMYIFPNLLNWAILISYLSLLVYFYFKNKKYFFALAFIFAATLPSMAPVKVSWLVAERYMFLGSLGFALFLGLIILDMAKISKYISVVMFSLVFVLFAFRSYLRNIDWQTNHNLWVNTCQVSPNSHNAWNNIGDDYDKLKQYDNAIKGFTQSTIVKPNYADAFHNRANIFFKIGRLDLARDSYNSAISFSPGLYQTYLSLVQIDLTESKLDLALVHAKKALELQPNNPQAAYILGVVYAQSGQIDEAKKIMTTVTENYPGYQLASEALKKLNEIKK